MRLRASILVAFAAVMLLARAIAVPTVKVPVGLVFTDVHRVIDISTNVEHQASEYTIANRGPSPAPYFLVAIPSSKVSHLALVDASTPSGSPLHATQVSVPGAPKGASVFQVTLPAPLTPGATARARVVISYTHTQVPFPAAIEQKEEQLVLYADSTHIYTPHLTEKQRTLVSLSSETIESFSPRKSASRSGKQITFGPYTTAAAPYTAGEVLSVHAANNSPFATMRTMDKEVEVSHWGNVAVTEHYILQHTGAALKGEFLRSNYQSPYPSERGRASFHIIPAELPPSAHDIYIRDVIGNISTSRARHEPSRVFVEVKPRYPLFGGWKADLEFGYSLPAGDVLGRNKEDPTEVVLDIPFGSSFPTTCVDDAAVRVILPEGARNIRWETPFDIDSASFETRLTYLDTSGRPVLVLRKANIVAGHRQNIRVVYSFPSHHLWREPGLLVGAVFALMLATMIYVRVDLSFGKGPEEGGKRKLKVE